jgi:hypothetical protein
LDRKIKETDCDSRTYDSATDQTTLNLPYDLAAGRTMQVVSRATSTVEASINYKVLSTGTDTLVIGGDRTADPLWIGEQYTFKYTFSEPALQVASQRGGMAPVLSGRFQVRRGTLLYAESGYFKVSVTPDNQTAFTYPFTAQIIGAGLLTIGAPSITSGIFKFPVMARHDEVKIEVTNDSPLPTRLLSAEWEASYDRRSARMG